MTTEHTPLVRAFIQARMSSSRFPGKVLAPFAGRPIIAHVIDRVALAIPREYITLATSTEPSDDPLAAYVITMGITVFRGSLNDVFLRFQDCLKQYPCDCFFRVCADSPLLDDSLFRKALTYTIQEGIAIVTNVYPRSFPKGNSIELIYAHQYAAIDPFGLTDEEKEHVTKFFYNHPQDFKIVNFESGNAALSQVNLCVDTIEDMRRLENQTTELKREFFTR